MSEVIYSYAADQAIEEGYLTPLQELFPDEDLAVQQGFSVPVRFTPGVLALVEVPEKCPWQNTKGRTWDILHMAAHAIRRAAHSSCIEFQVALTTNRRPDKPFLQDFIAALDTTGQEPAIHIFRPDEDWPTWGLRAGFDSQPLAQTVVDLSHGGSHA